MPGAPSMNSEPTGEIRPDCGMVTSALLTVIPLPLTLTRVIGTPEVTPATEAMLDAESAAGA